MSFYRNVVWFAKGMREYTQSGYLAAAKHFKPDDLNVACAGKSFMITGANSGIGKQAALEIAKRGGTVHLVCRNPTTAEEAKNEIVTETSNDNVFIHILDISQPKAVCSFAKEFEKSGKTIDVLVNNAGCMVNKRELTDDDLERNFATNTLGTHLMTVSFIPILEKSPDPRVILVSSGGMLTNKLNVDDLQCEKLNPFDGTMAYAQNKRQQIIMTEKYAVKYPNVFFASMHPGWADTPAVRMSMPDFYEKMKNRLRTVEQGADTIVWLAISPAVKENKSGLFFQDRRAVSTHLPLAWTRSNSGDEDRLMVTLQDYQKKYEV